MAFNLEHTSTDIGVDLAVECIQVVGVRENGASFRMFYQLTGHRNVATETIRSLTGKGYKPFTADSANEILQLFTPDPLVIAHNFM